MQGIHPGFEIQGRRHQKFKTGVAVAHEKDLCPPRNFKKNKNKNKNLLIDIFNAKYISKLKQKVLTAVE